MMLRALFGHQSVGADIVEALRKTSPFDAAIIECRQPVVPEGPLFMHALIGVNRDPLSKIAEMRRLLAQGLGDCLDLVLMKFCYVDIESDAVVLPLFDAYLEYASAVSRDFPRLAVGHVTVPLRSCPSPAGHLLRRLLNQPDPELERNAAREHFNALLRHRYGAGGLLFDLAGAESRGLNGSVTAFSWRGRVDTGLVTLPDARWRAPQRNWQPDHRFGISQLSRACRAARRATRMSASSGQVHDSGSAAGAPMTVREVDDSDAKLWDQFLNSHPAGSFYHLFGWHRIVRTCLNLRPLYLMALQDERPVGVLPLVLLSSRLFGRILCSVPFLNYGGPCATSDQATKSLVAEAVNRARLLQADYLELRCAGPLPVELPASLHKVSMTIGLDPDPDVIWNAFTRKHRKNVRHAYKSGLEFQSGGIELLDDFYPVLERSWRDFGTPLYQRSYFEAILEEFSDQTCIYLCRKDKRAVCVALNGFHAGTSEGLWAGALPSARDLQAIYVLYWEMIRDACERRCNRFHLGRSTADSGSEKFKSRWNAEARQLYWYFHRPDGGPTPALKVDNPRYRLAIAAWRQLPLWVVRRLGPSLARCIP